MPSWFGGALCGLAAGVAVALLLVVMAVRQALHASPARGVSIAGYAVFPFVGMLVGAIAGSL